MKGINSSEFKVGVLALPALGLLVLLAAFFGHVPVETQAKLFDLGGELILGGGGAYTVSRGLAKIGIGIAQATQQSDATTPVVEVKSDKEAAKIVASAT